MGSFIVICWLLLGMVIWGASGSDAMERRRRLLPPEMKWNSRREFVLFYVIGSWGLIVNLILYVFYGRHRR